MLVACGEMLDPPSTPAPSATTPAAMASPTAPATATPRPTATPQPTPTPRPTPTATPQVTFTACDDVPTYLLRLDTQGRVAVERQFVPSQPDGDDDGFACGTQLEHKRDLVDLTAKTATPTPTVAPATPQPARAQTPWRMPTSSAIAADAAAKKCLSAWDGSHRGTNELIKDELVSPDSFEHVETQYRTTLIQGGRILVLIVEFSATNAFNARLRGTAWGHVNVETCEAVDASLLG